MRPNIYILYLLLYIICNEVLSFVAQFWTHWSILCKCHCMKMTLRRQMPSVLLSQLILKGWAEPLFRWDTLFWWYAPLPCTSFKAECGLNQPACFMWLHVSVLIVVFSACTFCSPAVRRGLFLQGVQTGVKCHSCRFWQWQKNSQLHLSDMIIGMLFCISIYNGAQGKHKFITKYCE